MSRMKHLLRKLHIGGGLNEHHRLSESRRPNNSSPAPSSSSVLASSSILPGNRVADGAERNLAATDGAVDFNFFEEEFQVQLALAISASDTDACQDPESIQIKAAKRMSLGCSPSATSDDTLVDFLSLRYWNYDIINYDEKVMDGFYDVYGITLNSGMPGKMPLLVDLQATSILDNVDYEVVSVNRCVDPALQQLERTAISIALECRAAELGPVLSGLVQKIADLVVDSMGGPVGNADEMLRRWTVRSYELRKSLNTIILPIGCLDIGLSRHRALLFKVLADQINLPCRLVKGSYYTGTDEGAVNLIKVDSGSEYIIDLMGAPGMLIPTEIPSNHFQNFGLDVTSCANIAETVKDPSLVLDKVNGQFDNKIGTLGGVSPDLNNILEIGGSGSGEASSVDARSKGDDVNLVGKNQTEKFEHEFGKLLPSLHRSHGGMGGKASPAQKMKVKDVSKYVITAAQNPEFAQKLHAVLLESGASPPADLFSSIAPLDLGQQKVVIPNHLVEGERIDDGAQWHRDRFSSSTDDSHVFSIGEEPLNYVGYEKKQNHSAEGMAEKCREDASASSNLKFEKPSSDSSSTNKPGFGSSNFHQAVSTNIINSVVDIPFVTATSEGFVLADYGVNGMIPADTMCVGTVPVNLPIVIARNSFEPQIEESSMPCAADSCQRQLENAFTSGVAQCSQGNAIIMANNVETNRGCCILERQQSAKGACMKFMEIANNEPHVGSNVQRERINPMLDEVAEWEVPWEDLQIGERIGLGSYGEVYRADWNGTEVAVKKFLDQDFSGDALEQFRCEVKLMLRLRHPNVVLFMGAVIRPPNLSILTEFLPRGSLYRLLHRPNIQLDEKRRLRMALDVAKGMNYLHTSHPTIVHRDLKSPNLLVDKNWVVKVCDFGLSRLKHHTFLTSKSTAGTPEWMAPEVLRNEPSNEKCDVYSFGVILWELATLQMPWSGVNPMQVVGAVGFQDRRLEIPDEVDPTVAQIICDCWQSDPKMRPSFLDLISSLKRLQHLVVDKM